MVGKGGREREDRGEREDRTERQIVEEGGREREE